MEYDLCAFHALNRLTGVFQVRKSSEPILYRRMSPAHEPREGGAGPLVGRTDNSVTLSVPPVHSPALISCVFVAASLMIDPCQSPRRHIRNTLDLPIRPRIILREPATKVLSVTADPPQNSNFGFVIVGAGRGGTSLLAGLLDSHPQLEVGFEVGAVDYLLGKALPDPENDTFEEKTRLFVSACQHAAVACPGVLWGNKITTEQILGLGSSDAGGATPAIGLLDSFFNDTLEGLRVIFILRDGRACVSSKVRRTGQSFESACRRWQYSVECLRFFDRHHSNNLCLRFEDLLTQPETTLSRICTFLSIPYRSQMLNGVNSRKLPHEYRYGTLDRSKATPASIPNEYLCRIREDLIYTGYIQDTNSD